jgi:hypothetical protein
MAVVARSPRVMATFDDVACKDKRIWIAEMLGPFCASDKSIGKVFRRVFNWVRIVSINMRASAAERSDGTSRVGDDLGLLCTGIMIPMALDFTLNLGLHILIFGEVCSGRIHHCISVI